MDSSSAQPLSGVRVIDFTQVMLGPSATQVLADYGADVIKIERPGAGDLSRSSIPDDPDGLDNPVFRSLNRNKRSIALDLRKAEGREIIYDLVRTADVVVNNFRAGVMERMGFGYEQLSKINPRIICAFGSGFGQAGPLSHKGGQDILAQALSGVMRRKCNDDEPLTVYATALCDYTAGMHLVQAILLALLQREKTGHGQQVAVSLFESMLAMQMQEAAMWLQRGKDLSWGSYPLTGCFATTDGAVVLVGAFKANPLRDICKALDLPDLSADPRYATFQGQVEHKAELQGKFRERFASNTTAYWLARLDELDLLCSPVLTLAEALGHEQTKLNGTVVTLSGGATTMALIGTPLTMAPDAFQLRRPPPALGADGTAVLAEAGFSAERIAALKAQGIVA
ncbi:MULTISPECIES: CaiB/BaiF CoA transferase family protein [unclassified Bradyrhizobium]|uniref:CaiB/BaiF CoA transferase family protein n=1 Tax=unclassified Bradyrhizobium TaxID=2631580 RepID=UPI0023060F53|nr:MULTISPECIES: CaiB/BaiF CoA-transferase family protein [unclassified Bradyrhizobium]MDA9410082.1 CoA-transferase [Bradyrhizobium sp. CCBAU 45384]MDA9441959.1 CoA-transferase [Bradyrhizobium sp. CCBAU 51745]